MDLRTDPTFFPRSFFWVALPVDVIRNPTGKENSAGKDKNQTREKLRL